MSKKYDRLDGKIYAVELNKILTTSPTVSRDILGEIVAEMSDVKEQIVKLKRINRKKLCWFSSKPEDADSYISTKNPDTPDNRALYKKRFGDEIDIFLGDLLTGL